MSSHTFVSAYNIGDPVWITLGENQIPGWVRTVTFTRSKVRYSVVYINPNDSEFVTTLHNIDSFVVSNRAGEWLDLGEDNYS